jgi:peptidoglycan/xylan/chitin deacetylase (PgdA/CDA1 family)
MTRRRGNRLLTGLLAIPLSALPFVAYGSWTPQGRHLAAEVRIALDRPELPDLDAATVARVRAAAPSYEGHVMPLVYHGIGSQTAGEGDLAVSPERFAEHLAALREAGMQFVTTQQVADAFAGGAPLPPDAVLLTFDDGRADAALWATPLLEDAGAVATMFVIADQARGGPYYASWDELAGGDVWDVQSHTAGLHHDQPTADGPMPALTSLAKGESLADWRTRVREDLDRADAEIEEHTGRRPVAFAYPFGAWGGDRTNDPTIESLLGLELMQRYRLAFHQDGQDDMTLAGPEVWPLGLRRLEVGDWDGVELVERIAAAAERTRAVGAH